MRRRAALRAGAACAAAALFAPLSPLRRVAAAGGAYRHVDPARLRGAFAPPAQAPELLLAFARWLDSEAPPGLPLAEGLSGDDGRWTSRFNDFWIEEGADLSESFAIFLTIGDGGDVALWNRRGDASSHWPVVLLGGEGEAVVLADSFAGFLARLALQRFDDEAPDDADRYAWGEFEDAGGADARIARTALGGWLREQAGRDDLSALARREVPPDALRGFFDAHRKTVLGRRSASADWRALDALLQQDRANARKSGGHRDLFVVCAGDFFRIGDLSAHDRRFVPHPRSTELEAPIRALREERAHRFPAHGLWFHARLRAYDIDPSAGRSAAVDLVAQYLDDAADMSWLPRPPAAAIRADCARRPRSSWWTPAWLRAILAAASA